MQYGVERILTFEEFVYIVKPKCLSYEYIENTCEWNYFYLELDELNAVTPDFQIECYAEELCEMAPLKYHPLEVMENMSQQDYVRLRPRHIVRYLKGSLVVFHKNSIYNRKVAKYQGEHSKYTVSDFRQYIVQLAGKYKENHDDVKEKSNLKK